MPFSPASSSSPCVQSFPKREPKYSFSWASSIVDQAFQAHARAWESMASLTGLTRRQLAYLVACSDPAWPWLRSAVHVLDKWHARQALVRSETLEDTPQLLSTLVRLGQKTCPESLYHYLTDRISRLMLEEQVKKADGEGPDSPSILSLAAQGGQDGQLCFDFR